LKNKEETVDQESGQLSSKDR